MTEANENVSVSCRQAWIQDDDSWACADRKSQFWPWREGNKQSKERILWHLSPFIVTLIFAGGGEGSRAHRPPFPPQQINSGVGHCHQTRTFAVQLFVNLCKTKFCFTSVDRNNNLSMTWILVVWYSVHYQTKDKTYRHKPMIMAHQTIEILMLRFCLPCRLFQPLGQKGQVAFPLAFWQSICP